ncbi:MAG: single-stranded DNA-binding protein [Candidatus Margulisiibacteriota bacterium]
MSQNYNQVTLVGRLAKDPEIKRISNTQSKTTFILAVERQYRRPGTAKETDFIPICLWGRTAEISYQLLKKGSAILVWGRIQVRNYDKDDQRHWITEVVAENFQILDYSKSKEIPPIEPEDKPL